MLVGDLFNFFTTYSEGFKSISAGAECQYPTSQLATTHVCLITNFTHPWHYGILEQLLFGIWIFTSTLAIPTCWCCERLKKNLSKRQRANRFSSKRPRCPAAATDISADLNIITYNVWSQPSSFHGRLHQLQGLLPVSSTDTCTHCCGHCHHVTSQSWSGKTNSNWSCEMMKMHI